MQTVPRAIGTTLIQWDQATFPDVVDNPEIPQGSRLISTQAARHALVASGTGLPDLSVALEVDLETSVLVVAGYHSCMEQGAVLTDGKLVWFEARTAPEHEGIICAWSPFTAQIIEVPREAFSGDLALVNPHSSRFPATSLGRTPGPGTTPADLPDLPDSPAAPPVRPPDPSDSRAAPQARPPDPSEQLPAPRNTRRPLLVVGVIAILILTAGGIWWVSVSRGPGPEETALLTLARAQGFSASGDACEVMDGDRDAVVATVQCMMPGVPSSPGSSAVVLYRYDSLADLRQDFPTLHGDGEPEPLTDGHIAEDDLLGVSVVVWSDESTRTLSVLSSPDFSSAELHSWWREQVDDF